MDRLTGLPPGSILQLMHFERRIKNLAPGNFIEVGPGAGDITAILLEHGWKGRVFDLHQPTIDKLSERFSSERQQGCVKFECGDFLKVDIEEGKADLFVTCMVLEHIPKPLIPDFMDRIQRVTNDDSRVITFVPGSPKHWGIEDDIAGHIERYTRETLTEEFSRNGFQPVYCIGLTYPVSNLLLPISNRLISNAESDKKSLSLKNRTALSGDRKVKYKTYFPKITHLILNRLSMKPFDWIQRLFKNNVSCLVIYQESAKRGINEK